MKAFLDAREECFEHGVGLVHTSVGGQTGGKSSSDANEFFVGKETGIRSFSGEDEQPFDHVVGEKSRSNEHDEILLLETGEKRTGSQGMSHRLLFVDGANRRMSVDEFVPADERSEANELFALETGGVRVQEQMALAGKGEHPDQIGQVSTDRRQSEATKRRIDLLAKFLLARFQRVEQKGLVRLLIMVGK